MPSSSVPQGRLTVAHQFTGGTQGRRARLSPVGTAENVPAVHCWGGCEATGESVGRAQSSLRDYATSVASRPALKRWAIVGRPSGTTVNRGSMTDSLKPLLQLLGRSRLNCCLQPTSHLQLLVRVREFLRLLLAGPVEQHGAQDAAQVQVVERVMDADDEGVPFARLEEPSHRH